MSRETGTNGQTEQAFSQAECDAMYRAIFERRDVRSQFRADPLPKEVLLRLCCLNFNASKLRPTNENSSCRCARLDHQRKLEAKGVEMLEWLVAGCGQQCGAEIHPSL